MKTKDNVKPPENKEEKKRYYRDKALEKDEHEKNCSCGWCRQNRERHPRTCLCSLCYVLILFIII